MRALRLVALASIATVGAFASCRTTSEECETYCESVAEQLARCDLLESESDFDLEDCYERTSDVEADTCAETATKLLLASCDAVSDSFCPDPTLACPTNCFGVCCVDSDCPFDRPACELGECKACTEETAAQFCATKSCYLDECVECTEATATIACAAGEGCDYNNCRKTCSSDEDCGDPFRSCVADFCSEPVGTPCVVGDVSPCGTGANCLTYDAAGLVVSPYCSIFCLGPEECPAGYVCDETNYECLQL